LNEIFGRRNYAFVSDKESPLILDCGANIGLSCIYFKRCYPASRITAFEADPDICDILRHNLELYAFADVDVLNCAVWDSNAKVDFVPEGGFSGRVPLPSERIANSLKKTIPAVRLRDYLKVPVDFLKIDIEGAETRVLVDCAPQLQNVNRCFVEYHAPEGGEQTLHTLLGVLQHSGFRYHVKEAYAAAQPFVRRPALAGMEFQADIYAYRP
jgi:FkbM family methyltransferase